jgi:hypothetical protein
MAAALPALSDPSIGSLWISSVPNACVMFLRACETFEGMTSAIL